MSPTPVRRLVNQPTTRLIVIIAKVDNIMPGSCPRICRAICSVNGLPIVYPRMIRPLLRMGVGQWTDFLLTIFQRRVAMSGPSVQGRGICMEKKRMPPMPASKKMIMLSFNELVSFLCTYHSVSSIKISLNS